MELLIVVAGVCLLGVLANRYGFDSRSRLLSSEEQFAATGMTWDALDQRAAHVAPIGTRPSTLARFFRTARTAIATGRASATSPVWGSSSHD